MIESLLLNFSEVHRVVAYFIIFIGMIIEGEMILVLAGILIKNGNLDFFDTLIISFIGMTVNDIIWWFIGIKLFKTGKKKFLFFNLEKTNGLLKLNNGRNDAYIFISKFTWAFNKIVLLRSGYLKTPFKTLMSYSMPATAVWIMTFISLGFFFAHKMEILKRDVKTVLLSITILFLFIMIFEGALQRILKKARDVKI